MAINASAFGTLEPRPLLAFAQLVEPHHQLAARGGVAIRECLALGSRQLADLIERLRRLLHEALDRADVLRLELLEVLAHRRQARRDRGGALDLFLLACLALGGLGRTSRVFLGLALVEDFAPGALLGLVDHDRHDRRDRRDDGGRRGHGLACLALALDFALDGAQLVGGARLLLVELLAFPEPRSRLGEPLVRVGVPVVGGAAELLPGLVRRADQRRDLVEIEAVGDGLELAHQLDPLGAPALDVVGDARHLRALGLGHLGDDLARALAHRLVLRLLRDVLESIAVLELVGGREPDLFLRRIDRERAQHVAVVDPRDRGDPEILRRIALGQLGQRTWIAELAERALAQRRQRRVDRDLDQRVLIAELDDPGERGTRDLGVFFARDVLPQLGRALARVVAQAAFGLGLGDLGEYGSLVDPLDRESAHADVTIASSHLMKDGSVVRGQSPDGFGAYANVAVAVLGAKEVCNPHGRGGIYSVRPPTTIASVCDRLRPRLLGRRPHDARGLVHWMLHDDAIAPELGRLLAQCRELLVPGGDPATPRLGHQRDVEVRPHGVTARKNLDLGRAGLGDHRLNRGVDRGLVDLDSASGERSEQGDRHGQSFHHEPSHQQS